MHGRVLFQQAGSPSVVTWLAAAESLCGFVIEGVFIAALVQRFLGAK
jgi:hypothetical protein